MNIGELYIQRSLGFLGMTGRPRLSHLLPGLLAVLAMACGEPEATPTPVPELALAPTATPVPTPTPFYDHKSFMSRGRRAGAGEGTGLGSETRIYLADPSPTKSPN